MSVDYRIGDVRDRLTEIPDGSVDLITCSPPFLALRSYLPSDHDAKHREIGSEATPAEFLSTLLGLAREWRRILAPHGSIAIELGDTYCGAGGYGSPGSLNPAYGGQKQEGHFEGRTAKRFKRKDDGWPLAKSLTGIPTLFAWSLAYGRNLLDPADTLDPWRVRNVIVWARPNPAVGALGDKFRPATSYITVACPSGSRWFDLDAVRTELKVPNAAGIPRAGTKLDRNGGRLGTMGDYDASQSAGAPPLDAWYDDPTDPDDGDLTWKLSTEGSSLAHYAMWPSTLAARLVDSMCPREVCTVCGVPRRRMVHAVRTVDPLATPHGKSQGALNSGGPMTTKFSTDRRTLGWSDCGHDSFRPGLVLDPFAGTGTTLAVADILGRDAIGIDLDPRNADLYPRRYDEVRRKLNPSAPRLSEGQLDIFGEVAS